MTDLFQNGRKVFWLILALSAILLFFRLGDRPFRNPDEGRYAQIAGNMTESGQWMQPRLFGIDYLRKPPLFYWLTSASFKVFGRNEWAARAVPALFGIAAVMAAYFFSRRFFGTRAAAFGALLMLANPWYLHSSRFLVIDGVFAFFVVTSLYLFYLGDASEGKKGLIDFGFYLSLALAVLAKGALGLLIPGLSVFFYMLMTRRWPRVFTGASLVFGGLLFFAAVSPWFVWITQNNPEFWHIFFVREHLSRFTAENFEHREGWYFYLVLMTLFFLPWIAVPGPLRIFRDKVLRGGAAGPARFLALSSAVTVLFLSLSKSKLASYLLPAIPQICIVLGAAWAGWTEGSVRRLKLFYIFLWVMALSVIPAVLVMEYANTEFTTKVFAERLKPELRPGDAVFAYDHPGPFYDFPFYLNHPVRPVGLEGEFEICREDADAVEASIARKDFLKLMEEQAPFYCIIRNSDWGDLPEALRAPMKVLMRDKRKTLFQSGAS